MSVTCIGQEQSWIVFLLHIIKMTVEVMTIAWYLCFITLKELFIIMNVVNLIEVDCENLFFIYWPSCLSKAVIDPPPPQLAGNHLCHISNITQILHRFKLDASRFTRCTKTKGDCHFDINNVLFITQSYHVASEDFFCCWSWQPLVTVFL